MAHNIKWLFLSCRTKDKLYRMKIFSILKSICRFYNSTKEYLLSIKAANRFYLLLKIQFEITYFPGKSKSSKMCYWQVLHFYFFMFWSIFFNVICFPIKILSRNIYYINVIIQISTNIRKQFIYVTCLISTRNKV